MKNKILIISIILLFVVFIGFTLLNFNIQLSLSNRIEGESGKEDNRILENYSEVAGQTYDNEELDPFLYMEIKDNESQKPNLEW